ncbi:MAG: MarR family transcriptional regulator [Candidatus Paceibacterota bacterium]
MSQKKPATRKKIIDSLISSLHKETRAATLFVHTISEITGIHPTDIKCLDFLSEVHSATAGELAKITGLTTGAITAVIDRLESAGFVKREADVKDRRKIIIRFIAGRPNHLGLVQDLFANKIPNLLSTYKTDEIKLIEEWNIKMAEVLHNEIEKLKISKKAKTLSAKEKRAVLK